MVPHHNHLHYYSDVHPDMYVSGIFLPEIRGRGAVISFGRIQSRRIDFSVASTGRTVGSGLKIR